MNPEDFETLADARASRRAPVEKTEGRFVVVVRDPRNGLHGRYLHGPRTTGEVKRYGYGFVWDQSKAWPFDSEKQAAAKALIVNRHMRWSEGVLIAEEMTEGTQVTEGGAI